MSCGLTLPVRLDVLNKGLQFAGAVELHLPGDVTVDVHGEGGGGMAQVLLKGLHVHAALDAGHGVGVPEIVDSGIGGSDLLDQPLEAVVHGAVREIPAEGTGEHQPCLLPLVSEQVPVVVLALALKLKELDHCGSHGDLLLCQSFVVLIASFFHRITPFYDSEKCNLAVNRQNCNCDIVFSAFLRYDGFAETSRSEPAKPDRWRTLYEGHFVQKRL